MFAGNTAAADEVSQHLADAGVEHGLYHKSIPVPESRAALAVMQQKPQGKVRLACSCTR